MNGTCDALSYTEGSLTQDTWISPLAPLAPLYAELPKGWVYYRRYGASAGLDFSNLPTNENLVYDEIHPAAYPQQLDPNQALAWARRVTQQVILYVEWTHNQLTRQVLQAIFQANNPLVLIAQEFFFFGEDRSHTPDDSIIWYRTRMPISKLIACHCISNQRDKLDPPGQPGANKYTRAFSFNPGDVMAYWAKNHKELAALGSYSRLQWGFGYRDRLDPITGRGRAIECWDQVLTASYF